MYMISGNDLCEYIYIDEEDRRLSENNILNTGRNGVGLLCFTQFSTIFQLYRGGQCYWWTKSSVNSNYAKKKGCHLLL